MTDTSTSGWFNLIDLDADNNIEPTTILKSNAGVMARPVSRSQSKEAVSSPTDGLTGILKAILDSYTGNKTDLIDEDVRGRDVASDVYKEYDKLVGVNSRSLSQEARDAIEQAQQTRIGPADRGDVDVFEEDVITEEAKPKPLVDPKDIAPDLQIMEPEGIEDMPPLPKPATDDGGLMSRDTSSEEGETTTDSGLMSKPYDAESMKAINDDMMVGPSVVIAPNVDFDFIKEREGYKNSMYVPKDKKKKVLGKSGPTIASGFDVGQRSLSDLKGLPATLVVKLEPYLGMKGAAADAYVTANELTLTNEEIDTINKFSKKQEINRLKEDWEGSTSTLGFDDLTEAQATVVASVAFQYGNLPTEAPTFWKHVTNGDWDKAEAELRAFGDKYPTRRTAEADFLAGN